MDWGADMSTVAVSRGLLAEILKDGTCPLHIRIELQKTLEPSLVPHDAMAEHACSEALAANICHDGTADEAWEERDCDQGESVSCELVVDPHCNVVWQFEDVSGPCLLKVAAHLPLKELLEVRACSQRCLSCFTQRSQPDLGELCKMQSRIRARLWIERVVALTKDTTDETIFETQVRSFANDALRRRMESEMSEAKVDMERQIHAFQLEVDRRMEEQAQRVHSIIEERVHQQVEMILSAEMEKVRVMAEERVQERVRTVLQEEVLATVREMQARLTVLAQENEQLRNAFSEHLDHSDLCYRSLVWALSPNATGIFARTLRFAWCCRHKLTKFCAYLLGVPPDRRKERLRMRLEALRRALDSDESLRSRFAAGEGNVEGSNGQATEGNALPATRPLMALMAAAQSADASIDGVSPLGVLDSTDLMVGGGRGAGEFAAAESASATATVIAAALLLASQAQRRNASAEPGGACSSETPQQAMPAKALPDCGSETGDLPDATDLAVELSQEELQNSTVVQHDETMDGEMQASMHASTTCGFDEDPLVEGTCSGSDPAASSGPVVEEEPPAASSSSCLEELPTVSDSVNLESLHAPCDETPSSPEEGAMTAEDVQAQCEETPEVEETLETPPIQEGVNGDCCSEGEENARTGLEAPSDSSDADEGEQLDDIPSIAQSDVDHSDDGGEYSGVDDEEEDNDLEDVFHDLPSDAECMPWDASGDDDPNYENDDLCSFDVPSEWDDNEERQDISEPEVPAEDAVAERSTAFETEVFEPNHSDQDRNVVPVCELQEPVHTIQE